MPFIFHPFPTPKQDDYEGDEQHILDLGPLAQQLNRDMPDENMDARAIARFQMGLIQFMENALGPNSMPPRPFAKLPFVWIDEVRPFGPLRDIIMKSNQLKEAKGLKTLDWLHPQQRMALLDILGIVRTSMEKNGYPVTPTVYFHTTIPEAEIKELSSFVEKMKGKVVTDRNAVGLTHIIYPFGPNGDPDDGQEYMRTQRKRGGKALVHRWYTPDSHNEWLDQSVAPEQVESDAEHLLSGPAKVYVRWVRDSRRYNEWMNIVDYETDEGNEDHEKYKEELRQRGFTPATFLERKRKAKQAGGAPKVHIFEVEQEVDPNFREEIAPGVVRRHVRFINKRVKEGVLLSENLSWGQMPKVFEGADAHAAMARVQVPREVTTRTNPAADAYIHMPVYAHWFRMESIHEIERNANVEFFNGRSSLKTPEIYVLYRNFMVQQYRSCPQARFTFMDCRKHLVGDINALKRIWSFLDSWGLINFEADPEPILDEPMEVLVKDKDSEQPRMLKLIGPGQSTMRTPTPDAVLKLPSVSTEKAILLATTAPEADARAVTLIGQDTSLLNKKEPSARPARDDISGAKLQFYCNAMPWVNCTSCRYHCSKYPDIDLCPKSFAEGRFPPGTCAKDFVKIDKSSSKGKQSGWSDQETLLLLEAIEMYGENWDKVAEYVGTKTKLDCLLHFLQLPIHEECVTEARMGTVSRGCLSLTASDDFPFSKEENALASQLIFLAEVVGAKISAAAAAAAMQELFEQGSVLHAELLQASAAAAGLDLQNQAVNTTASVVGSNSAGVGGSDLNGSAPMAVDPPSNGGAVVHEDANVLNNINQQIPPRRLFEAACAAFQGAGIKAKQLAESHGWILSGHSMTVLEAMTHKMVTKNKYLNDIEGEIASVYSRLVGARKHAVKEKEKIAALQKELEVEKAKLAAAEELQRQDIAEHGTDSTTCADTKNIKKEPASDGQVLQLGDGRKDPSPSTIDVKEDRDDTGGMEMDVDSEAAAPTPVATS